MTLLNISPFAISRWGAFFNHFDLFFKGFLYTLGISFGALLLALILGILSGGLSTSKSKVGKLISRIYVEVFQNTPLLVQCVGLYHGAYISEVIRSGIEAVPKGQTEAALAQGFTANQTMQLIILPQAVRTILPPMTNQVVNLIKNTSTVAIISGADIMFVAKAWAYDTTNYIPAFAGAAIFYFVICFPLASWARKQEELNKKTYS